MTSHTLEQKMPNIKLITFDLDDTFWDISPVIIKAEMATRSYLESHIGKQDWGSMSDFLSHRKELIKEDPSYEWDIGALRKKIYENKIKKANLPLSEQQKLVKQCYEMFLKLRHEVEFYDGVYEAIEELSKNYSLGVLTNGNADIFSFEIGKFFDFSISSYDVQSNKPKKDHFVMSKNKYKNLEFDQIIHIGDHPVNDVYGSHMLGINAIWFNKNNDGWDNHDIEKPIQFNSWKSIVKLISDNYER